MNITHDIVATVGKYTDREGNEKKRYAKCGVAFTDDEGRISLKMDAMPVSPDWSGWLSLYPVESRQDAPQERRGPSQHQQAKQDGYAPQGGSAAQDDDDIPF